MASSIPLGNGDGPTAEQVIEMQDSSQIIKMEEGAKSLISIGAIHPVNRQGNVTKIFTLSKPNDVGTSTNTPTQIVVAPVGSRFDPNSSPAQTVTVQRASILPNNSQTLTNVVTMSPQKIISVPKTPPRQIVSSKISMSPGKSPGKITMVPVGGIRSPQKVLQPGQIVSMVSQAGIASSQAFTTSKAVTVSSPNKVIIQRQPLVRATCFHLILNISFCTA